MMQGSINPTTNGVYITIEDGTTWGRATALATCHRLAAEIIVRQGRIGCVDVLHTAGGGRVVIRQSRERPLRDAYNLAIGAITWPVLARVHFSSESITPYTDELEEAILSRAVVTPRSTKARCGKLIGTHKDDGACARAKGHVGGCRPER